MHTDIFPCLQDEMEFGKEKADNYIILSSLHILLGLHSAHALTAIVQLRYVVCVPFFLG